MLRLCALFVLALAALPAGAQTFGGTVHVSDGDTFRVGDVPVRLFGIDALEKEQWCGGDGVPGWQCGAWVASEVRAMFHGQEAVCERLDTDRYKRAVATCRIEGEDVGAVLVAQGLAFAYRKYSTRYDTEEKAARVLGKGLHGMGVQSPDDYRKANKRHRQCAPKPASVPANCVIKGNISQDGKHIYHLPDQRFYDRTCISASNGERWFCSEQEARSAGWRRSRR